MRRLSTLLLLMLALTSCSIQPTQDKSITLDSFPVRQDGLNERRCIYPLYLSDEDQKNGVYNHDEYEIIETRGIVYDDNDMPIEGYISEENTLLNNDSTYLKDYFDKLIDNVNKYEGNWIINNNGNEQRYIMISDNKVIIETKIDFKNKKPNDSLTEFRVTFTDENGNEYVSAKKAMSVFEEEKAFCRNAGE